MRLFGYSPAEALMAADEMGGAGSWAWSDLGLAQGFLADLLLVNGDPTQDVRILQDRDNLLMIMKDGAYLQGQRSRRCEALRGGVSGGNWATGLSWLMDLASEGRCFSISR